MPPPMTSAVTTTAADSSSWRQNRSGMPFEPVQLAEDVNQSPSRSKNDMSATNPDPSVGAGPRNGQSLGPHPQQIRDGGQPDRQHQADDDRGVVADVEPVSDLLTEAPEPNESGDGDQSDHGRGGHSKPGEDIGQRQWQIDPHQCRGTR